MIHCQKTIIKLRLLTVRATVFALLLGELAKVCDSRRGEGGLVVGHGCDFVSGITQLCFGHESFVCGTRFMIGDLFECGMRSLEMDCGVDFTHTPTHARTNRVEHIVDGNESTINEIIKSVEVSLERSRNGKSLLPHIDKEIHTDITFLKEICRKDTNT